MKDLKFIFNYNNKLNCNAFTVIDIKRKPEKFKVGDEYKIILQPATMPDVKGVATIESIREFKLDQLNEFMAYLETGYSVEQTKVIIKQRLNKEKFTGETIFLIILFVYKNGKI